MKYVHQDQRCAEVPGGGGGWMGPGTAGGRGGLQLNNDNPSINRNAKRGALDIMIESSSLNLPPNLDDPNIN